MAKHGFEPASRLSPCPHGSMGVTPIAARAVGSPATSIGAVSNVGATAPEPRLDPGILPASDAAAVPAIALINRRRFIGSFCLAALSLTRHHKKSNPAFLGVQ